MVNCSDALTIKIATLSPEGSIWMEKMREGADEVAQKTNNRVTIKYYPGGVMGDDKAVMRKIRIGQLHGGAMVAGSMVDFYKDNQIYALPLKFKSTDEIDFVRSHMDPIIIEGLEKSGFVTFGLAEGGFAYVMSNDPVHSIKELRHKKVWAPDNDTTIIEAVKAFGINPIPLSIADVRAGLQTGLIDTVATSPIGAIALQWHTQVKYLLDLPILYLYAVLVVDSKVFAQIAPEDQLIVRQALGRVFQELDRINRQDNIKAIEALKNSGIQFVKPTQEDLNEWYEVAKNVPDNLVKSGKLSKELVDKLEMLVSEYRTKNTKNESLTK